MAKKASFGTLLKLIVTTQISLWAARYSAAAKKGFIFNMEAQKRPFGHTCYQHRNTFQLKYHWRDGEKLEWRLFKEKIFFHPSRRILIRVEENFFNDIFLLWHPMEFLGFSTTTCSVFGRIYFPFGRSMGLKKKSRSLLTPFHKPNNRLMMKNVGRRFGAVSSIFDHHSNAWGMRERQKTAPGLKNFQNSLINTEKKKKKFCIDERKTNRIYIKEKMSIPSGSKQEMIEA